MEAVKILRFSQGVDARLMKWPEGHVPNVPVVDGTDPVKTRAGTVVFVVRQKGDASQRKNGT